MLCGEGYGKGIQKGGLYKDAQDFILFDVKIAGNWQPRESVENITEYFGIDTAPIILEGALQEAVDYVKTNPNSKIGTAKSEGLVGRPKVEMLDRSGNRIIVKIKVNDFK